MYCEKSFNQDHTTPLILASASGHVDCVSELIDQGADVNAKRVVRMNKLISQRNKNHNYHGVSFAILDWYYCPLLCGSGRQR